MFSGDFSILGPEGCWTLRDLQGDPFRLRSSWARAAPVQLTAPSAELVAASFVVLEHWADQVQLVPAGLNAALRTAPDTTHVAKPTLEVSRTSARIQNPIRTEWVLHTSGTTGTPKAVAHTLTALTRTARSGQRAKSLTWGLLYEPTRMAGIQVLLQALVAGSRIVAPPAAAPLTDKIRWMSDHGVNALSATPTLWRQILQCEAADGWPLQQVTLGGEVADQKTLSALAHSFPRARVTHVFASTETGAAFGVHDGVAGFPAEYLTEPPEGIPIRISDGTLQVHCPGSAHARPDGFVSTGDAVELRANRVFFLGRTTGEVNIGGVKVWPEEVEDQLRVHPAVSDVVVLTRASSLTGSLLTAQVVLHPAHAEVSGQEIRAWARERLPRPKVPASITVVEALDVTAAGKAKRQ